MEISFVYHSDNIESLPQNYLPLALTALQGERGFSHVLIPSVNFESAKDLTLSVVTSIELAELAENVTRGRLFALGPRTDSAKFNEPVLPDRTHPAAGTQVVLAVIDTGIAFWNKAFRTKPNDPTTSAFQAMGYMSLSADEQTSGVTHVLGKDLFALARKADKDGHQNLVSKLAHDHADSVYANGLRYDAFSHGTAMAHQMLSPFSVPSSTTSDGRSRLDKPPVAIGLELPASVLHDSSGSVLQAILPRVLLEVKFLAEAWAAKNGPVGNLEIHTVLSYGATGGPHNDEHPIVTPVRGVAANLGSTLVMPVGNQRQDMLHARFDGNFRDVGWKIPYDDSSANTVEFHGHGEVPQLVLHAPTGGSAEIPRQAGLSLLKIDGDKVIGASLVEVLEGSWRVILTLGATRPKADLPAPASGTWKLTVAGGQEVDVWIQRDDHLLARKGFAPHRQSRFEHAGYVQKNAAGRFVMDDAALPLSPIRRSGSASVLAACQSDTIHIVEAEERIRSGKRTAWYSGEFYTLPPPQPRHLVLVDDIRPNSGTLCFVNGTRRKLRVSGTSVAAAKHAGEMAKESMSASSGVDAK